jgi:ribonucleoside-diphosphate reductase alpha chain
MNKQGSTINGLMGSWSRAISFALQYGVPLKFIIKAFSYQAFEPSGFSKNKAIGHAKSVVDYVARWLELRFLEDPVDGVEASASEGLAETVVTSTVTAGTGTCIECGGTMVWAGTCQVCMNCGSNSGCG